MNSPSRPTRESTTRSSVWPENGHFIAVLPSLHAIRIERKAARELVHLAPDSRLDPGVAEVAEHAIDEVDDDRHLGFLHAPGGDGGRPESDAARDHRASRVEGNGVLVHGD